MDVCKEMMAKACQSLHRECGLEEVCHFIVEHCYEQVALVQRATLQGFPAADYAVSTDGKRLKQDWRQPPTPDLRELTEVLTNPGSTVVPPRLTRESTDEELERIEKRRRIAKAKLEEQEALLQMSRLSKCSSQPVLLDVSPSLPTRRKLFTSPGPSSLTPSVSNESIEAAAQTQLALLRGGEAAKRVLEEDVLKGKDGDIAEGGGLTKVDQRGNLAGSSGGDNEGSEGGSNAESPGGDQDDNGGNGAESVGRNNEDHFDGSVAEVGASDQEDGGKKE